MESPDFEREVPACARGPSSRSVPPCNAHTIPVLYAFPTFALAVCYEPPRQSPFCSRFTTDRFVSRSVSQRCFAMASALHRCPCAFGGSQLESRAPLCHGAEVGDHPLELVCLLGDSPCVVGPRQQPESTTLYHHSVPEPVPFQFHLSVHDVVDPPEQHWADRVALPEPYLRSYFV